MWVINQSMIDQKEPTLDFNNHEDLNIDKNNLNLNYFKKIILPTETEKKITINIWEII